jgi:aspartyl-tRNA(Asn)/glutamyl-tRNA(Gln) amidotransferase subunit B
VDEAWKQAIKVTCPELPFDRQRRLTERYQLPYTITSVLVWDKPLAEYFEMAAEAAGTGKAQAVGNWITNDLLREVKATGIALSDCKVAPAQLANLVRLIDAGTVLNQAAKEIFVAMFQTGDPPAAIIERMGLKAEPTDHAELEQWCREAIAGNAKALAEFKGGKDSAINAFKGPVMKASRGKANPKLVDETLRRLLASS